jgi:hypothetical protein
MSDVRALWANMLILQPPHHVMISADGVEGYFVRFLPNIQCSQVRARLLLLFFWGGEIYSTEKSPVLKIFLNFRFAWFFVQCLLS